ncbi:VOC family protein [Bacillus sp. OTU2372]|uniref:VOC family protein n=1 Tax=Bacillus sp. OTU2372 TaxID=3043858 RepID=UPI00313B1367
MIKQFWINLPVKDINQSKEFYSKLGFSVHTRADQIDQAQLVIGNTDTSIMLFLESTFKHFIRHEIADTKLASEVLLSFDADSREEVERIAELAVNAGGTLYGEPSEIQGWMYGCGFTDLDGHRWNVLYMDMERMPKN